ncbi:MAG: intradiol ring-cleavage dioxygenase [Proteobacteria bacterium]|nr:intradiol ring-cleavage dioxygenase [Pseudomonadota bacterium]
MKLTLNRLAALLLLLTISFISSAQKNIVGGGCDGCELMYIDMPTNISPVSYSPAWNSDNQKLLITGKILQNDGVTPANNVLVYYWQTDENGHYKNKGNLNKEAIRHGYIRGWVKSDVDGNYSIYTIKPKAYPGRNQPAHIHLSVKEPNIADEYYVDKLVFNYDPLLTTTERKKFKNRGGSGLLRTLVSKDMIIAEHNIILGLNIPNYPVDETNIQSGLMIGENFPSITPYHAWGPDKGTKTCPVCRYGRHFGIMYFVNDVQSQEIKGWLLELEKQSETRGKYLKVYLIYANETGYSFDKRNKELEDLGKELDLKEIALTFVPSFNDIPSDVYLTKIKPNTNSTIIIFKNRNIIGKFLNLEAVQENFVGINQLLKENQGKYSLLPIDTRKN